MSTRLHHTARHFFNNADMIEWEEMPSRLAAAPAAETGSAWGVTMPAVFDARPQPGVFRESLRGLAVREVNEPEVFRHFFG